MRFVITAGADPRADRSGSFHSVTVRPAKMGYAMAEAALEAGHDVTLISGPVNLEPPPRRRTIRRPNQRRDVSTRSIEQIRVCDVLVMCAAVADYKPEKLATQKIKKGDQPLSLQLVPTRDILASLPRRARFSRGRFRGRDYTT